MKYQDFKVSGLITNVELTLKKLVINYKKRGINVAEIKVKYGREKVEVKVPDSNLINVLESKTITDEVAEEHIIKEALENPIGSRRLKEMVKKGEKICIVISDITRAWQRMSVYLPYIVEELKEAGVQDEDIIFISATGSHRNQTEEEHRMLLGDKLTERFKVIDHVSTNEEDLEYVGTTSFGTPVHINKLALKCDHIILTGAIIYHFLAGWGGGRKSILPGISGYRTIMTNHALSLSPEIGGGTKKNVKSGSIENNPIHLDMMEAAALVKPTFMFNALMGSNGRIRAAVAGDYIKAFEKGCGMVDEYDAAEIHELADIVVGSACGYPKDINLYQTSKTFFNVRETVKKGGTIIIMSQCSEGFGNEEMKDIMINYDDNSKRETSLREDYSIAKHIGYIMCEAAVNYNIILVSDMEPDILKKCNIKVVKNVDEALDIAYALSGKDAKVYVMPNGANTLPKLKRCLAPTDFCR